MDILGSLAGIILMSPLFLVTAMAIKLTSSGPVFYRQVRVGRFGRHFRIFKFRSMVANAEHQGSRVTARDDQRITPLGMFLRRHKLDEFPQLLNVLLGQMSLVGPRPEVPEFVAAYPRRFDRILKVRPGITHRATLLFRNEEELLAGADDTRAMYVNTILPWKLRIYGEHMQRQSLLDDVRTILDTIFLRHRPIERVETPLANPQIDNIRPFPANVDERRPVLGAAEELRRTASLNS